MQDWVLSGWSDALGREATIIFWGRSSCHPFHILIFYQRSFGFGVDLSVAKPTLPYDNKVKYLGMIDRLYNFTVV